MQELKSLERSGQNCYKKILVIGGNTGYAKACMTVFSEKGYAVTAIAVEKDSDVINKIKKLWEMEEGFYGVVIMVPAWKESSFLELGEGELEEAYGLLFRHPLRLLQAAALSGGADGRLKSIVLLSHIDGVRSSGNNFLAGSLHASLHRAAQSFALQLAPEEIRLNIIAAGMTEEEVEPCMAEAGLGKRLPLGRMGSAADAAALAELLMQEGSSWITGNIWMADGGYSLAGMPENDRGYGWDIHKKQTCDMQGVSS